MISFCFSCSLSRCISIWWAWYVKHKLLQVSACHGHRFCQAGLVQQALQNEAQLAEAFSSCSQEISKLSLRGNVKSRVWHSQFQGSYQKNAPPNGKSLSTSLQYFNVLCIHCQRQDWWMSSFRWVPWKSRAEREWLNDSSFHGMTSFESSFAGWSRPQVWWLSNKCTLIDLSIFCCSIFALSVCANSILHPEECTALWQQQWYRFVIVFCAHLTMEMPGGWRTTFHTIQKRRASEVPRTTQRQVQRGSCCFYKWRKRNGLQISRPAVCQVSQMSRQHQLGILAVNSIAGSGSPDCTLGNSESYSNSFSCTWMRCCNLGWLSSPAFWKHLTFFALWHSNAVAATCNVPILRGLRWQKLILSPTSRLKRLLEQLWNFRKRPLVAISNKHVSVKVICGWDGWLLECSLFLSYLGYSSTLVLFTLGSGVMPHVARTSWSFLYPSSIWEIILSSRPLNFGTPKSISIHLIQQSSNAGAAGSELGFLALWCGGVLR